MGLGETIRKQREDMGLSQAQLASAAGLSQGYLSQIENSEVANPSAAVLFRLAQALHLDPRSLLPDSAADYYALGGDFEKFETPIDPDLLRFLSQLTREQQASLLRFLREMEEGAPVFQRQE
ncbi:MAG TPA: helix-turn-helix transcriptional regulator [Dehalococcoidia bacterium]|nr:helix-turn-helix transcriptional regulator [Dehalococcoidia bacterium]